MADWKDAICLLTSKDPANRGFGTGFVFHRDGTGRSFLLTCLHVVETLEKPVKGGTGDPSEILAEGVPAEVWIRGDGVLDLAVLAVDGLDLAPLTLGEPAGRDRRIRTAGYTEHESPQQSVICRPLDGTIRDNNPVKSRLRPGPVGAWALDIEIDAELFRELKEGYSGSPVMDPSAGQVVGIMNLKWSGVKGHAICVRSVASLLRKANARPVPELGQGFKAAPPVPGIRTVSRSMPERFLVAFSFAGEQRPLVRAIAQCVESRLGPDTVFLDEWYEFWLAGTGADLKLQNLYGQRSTLAVVCVSERYGNKPWTRAEHEAIRARLMQSPVSPTGLDADEVLPIRVGDGDVPGIGFNAIVPDVRERPVEEAADLIVRRLQLLVPGLAPGPKAPPLVRPAGVVDEGGLDWMASTLDHVDPIERIAVRLDQGRGATAPGLWFYAVHACLSDSPRALAQHLAVKFGGGSPSVSRSDDLTVELTPARFDGVGLWKALVEHISPPGSGDDPEGECARVVHWINREPHAGSKVLRVVYCQLPIASLRPRIPGFIAGAVQSFAGLQGLRPDVRVLFLFACIAEESGLPALLGRLRPLKLGRVPACETLRPPELLTPTDLDSWLANAAKPLPGGRRLDGATLERLRSALVPLFPKDSARLRYRVAHEPALQVLRDATLIESHNGDRG